MPSERRAVIDVGTNSVKLLVADVDGHIVLPLLEKGEQTRLGRGFYETHILQADAITQTAYAVAAFSILAAQWESASTRVLATSAARDAVNQDELIDALRRACGLKIEIISGDEEAELVFRGVASDPRLEGSKLLILDVGGGSTEFILGEKDHHSFRQSFALGSVRLLEKLRPADPPSLTDLAGCRGWLKDLFRREIGPALDAQFRDGIHRGARLVGTGGTTTILARMEGRMRDFDRARIEGTCLSRPQVLEWMVLLWSLPLAERKNIVGLPPNRADIIPMGVAIYEAVMEHFQFDEVYVSTRGLRFGAVMDPP